MATKVIMPKQGLQMTEGTILQWFKREGDTVKEGEPLFEMETDKLTIEIDAPASGTVLKILSIEGDTVPITEVIAVIGENGEDISAIIAETGGRHESVVASVPMTAESKTAPEISAVNAAADERGRVFSTPRARMLIKEKGLNIENIQGSGPDGLIIERDVINLAAAATASPLAKRIAGQQGLDLSGVQGSGPRGKIYSRDIPASGAEAELNPEVTRRPLKGMRKIIAERMRSSLDTAAQAMHNVDVDMTEVVRMREKLSNAGVRASYNDIILKSTASALKQMPLINSSLQGDEIISYGNVNIGVAVALDEGLIVPVITDVDRKNTGSDKH